MLSFVRRHSRHIESTLHERALDMLGYYLAWLHQRGDWSDVEYIDRRLIRRSRKERRAFKARLVARYSHS